MTPIAPSPHTGSAVAGSAPADIVDIAGGYFAEKRADGFAIRHERGGLHMALPPEIATMVNAIAALRAELKELDALKADIANVLTDLTDCSIENDALRARVAELGSADTCGRVCEGTAYRLEARSLRARVAELESGYVPVGWQWLDTGHFRKSIPNDSDACDWNRIYRRS